MHVMPVYYMPVSEYADTKYSFVVNVKTSGLSGTPARAPLVPCCSINAD